MFEEAHNQIHELEEAIYRNMLEHEDKAKDRPAGNHDQCVAELLKRVSLTLLEASGQLFSLQCYLSFHGVREEGWEWRNGQWRRTEKP